ncbi:hypothetical protein ON010_g13312 [Phytophthora cinnamomi]|nr:hypothetical protein ON010_g13312 [Phytophthora cinnamomi]
MGAAERLAGGRSGNGKGVRGAVRAGAAEVVRALRSSLAPEPSRAKNLAWSSMRLSGTRNDVYPFRWRKAVEAPANGKSSVASNLPTARGYKMGARDEREALRHANLTSTSDRALEDRTCLRFAIL